MKSRAIQSVTMVQTIMFKFFKVLESLSYKLAGYYLYILWFMPGAKKQNSSRKLPETTRPFWLKVGNKRIRYWESGAGPTVLFVHGWGSYGAQFSRMINAIQMAGFRTLWFDAPAHGYSSGRQTNIFEVNECISRLQDKYGAFEMLIGHSFGALSSMWAISEGLSVRKMVAISPPSGAASLVDKFCFVFNARNETREHIKTFIEKKYGAAIWERLSAPNMAKNIKQPVLLIHDKNDPVVSCKEGISLKSQLVNVDLVLTEQLGHNRILNDANVINTVLKFIGNTDNMEKSAVNTRRLVNSMY